MTDLIARPATEGLGLPLTLGTCTLIAAPETPRTSVAPFAGQAAAVAALLNAPLSVGNATALGPGRLIWTGLGQWLLEGIDPPAGLGAHAALTDQSDGWTALRLTGPDAGRVLARLTPLDLARAVFPPGSAARSLLGHVPVILIAVPEGVDLLVMRSFTATAAHEIAIAMRAVAAISEIS